MSSGRRKWEDRYQDRTSDPTALASSFLRKHLQELPRGRALDIACGEGRHALLLARHGFAVEAVDFAGPALRRLQARARHEGLDVLLVQADLEHFPLPQDRYALVVNVRYLQRSLWPAIRHSLRAGGIVVYETFLVDQRNFGHPRNPSFLLDHGELRRGFSTLEISHYEEGLFETESGQAFLARMIARRP